MDAHTKAIVALIGDIVGDLDEIIGTMDGEGTHEALTYTLRLLIECKQELEMLGFSVSHGTARFTLVELAETPE